MKLAGRPFFDRACLCALLGVLGCWRPIDEAPQPRVEDESIRPMVLGSPDTNLRAIRDLVIGSEWIWIVGSGDVPLAVYSTVSGSRYYPISVGDGPTQARFVASVDVDETNSAVVWDGILQRIIRVDTAGRVQIIAAGSLWAQLNEAPRWDYLGGTINQVMVLASGIALGRTQSTRSGSGDLARTAIVSLNSAGLDTVLEFRSVDRWLDSVGGTKRLYAPFPLWDRCDRARVAVYDPSLNRVSILDSTWQAVDSFQTNDRVLPRTELLGRALFFRSLAISTNGRVPLGQLAQRVSGAPASVLEEAARVIPSYVNIICTPAGKILLQRMEVSMAPPPWSSSWEVYSRAGTTRRFDFPPGFVLMDATDELLVGFLVDSMDVPSVASAPWPRGAEPHQ